MSKMKCELDHVQPDWTVEHDNEGQKILYTGEYEVCTVEDSLDE